MLFSVTGVTAMVGCCSGALAASKNGSAKETTDARGESVMESAWAV